MRRSVINFLKPYVKRFPRIEMIYRIIRDSKKYYVEPRVTPMGFKLIGNKTMEEGNFEPEETEIFESIIKNVDVFINVGANIGYYCCLALNHKKFVIAFEPISLNVRYLLKNIKANNWEDFIEVYPIALSNKKSGLIEIYGGGTGASLIKGWAGASTQHVNYVPINTLDNILGDKLNTKKCFIVVDIEGAEQFMLEGSSIILEMDPKPIWMVEISISEHQPNGLKINPNLVSTFQLFWDRGYIAKTANVENRVVLPNEIHHIVKTGIDTIQSHNFLFIEK